MVVGRFLTFHREQGHLKLVLFELKGPALHITIGFSESRRSQLLLPGPQG